MQFLARGSLEVQHSTFPSGNYPCFISSEKIQLEIFANLHFYSVDFKLRKLPASILALKAEEMTPEQQAGRVFQQRDGGAGRSSSPLPPEMPLDICLKPRLQGMFEQKPAQLCASLGEFVLQARNLKPETRQSRGSWRKGDY